MSDTMLPTGVDYEALRTFQEYCHQASRDRGFYDEPDQLLDLCEQLRGEGRAGLADYIYRAYLGNRLMLIAGEVSEAHEEDRAGNDPGQTYYLDGDRKVYPGDPYIREGVVPKPEGAPSELADIFIRLMDHAKERGIDMGAAVKEKLEYNATRPYKHGKKY